MKKVLLIVLVLLLACCCCSVIGFALVGHFYSGNQCVWKGPLAAGLTGPCATRSSTLENELKDPNTTREEDERFTNNNSLTYTGKNSSKYTFEYDQSLILDDNPSNSSIAVIVRADDLDEQEITGFNDNLNISQKSIYLAITQSSCDSYTDSVLDQLAGSTIEVDTDYVSAEIETINGKTVCHASWYAENNGVKFFQDQYLFTDKSANATYVLTLSTGNLSNLVDKFMKTVDSFEIL